MASPARPHRWLSSTQHNRCAVPWRVACRLRVVALAAAVVTLLFLSACGSSGTNTATTTSPTSVAPTSAITVAIKNFAFHPADFTVNPAATITAINDDQIVHTLTADDRAFNTGDITNGVPVTFTAPTQPGRYPFRDLLRPFITGILTVS